MARGRLTTAVSGTQRVNPIKNNVTPGQTRTANARAVKATNELKKKAATKGGGK